MSADYVCVACGAKQERNTIRCERCGKPLVFSVWRAVDETSYGNGWVVLDPDWMARPRRHYCSCERAARRYAALRTRAWLASPFGRRAAQ